MRYVKKKSSFRPLIAALGEVLWDMFPSGKQPGGAPANFVHHAGRLGADAFLVSRVGRDDAGDELLACLEAHGIPFAYIGRDPQHPTGTVHVTVDVTGQPDYTIREHVAWDFLPWESELASLASQVDAVCFGSLCQRNADSRTTVERFLNATPETCARIFDINLRQGFYTIEILRHSLELATLLKLNTEELNVLSQGLSLSGTPERRLKQILERYSLDLVALTRGQEGSLLVTSEMSSEHSGFPVEVVDTVGAGDAFTAALVLGWLKCKDLDEINRDANRVAGQVCSHKGAWTPLDTPSRRESYAKQ